MFQRQLYRVKPKRSRGHLVAFGASILFSLSALSYVWWMKGADWKLSYRGVERDIARQYKKLGIERPSKTEEKNSE